MTTTSTNDQTPPVQVRGLSKRFGQLQVLAGVDLAVQRGEVVVLMGPSGSGKTTLIRCLNFLELADAGSIGVCGVQVRRGGKPLSRAEQHLVRQIRLRTAMVFQSFNLFPHMTALENVTIGPLTVQRVAPAQARDQGLALLAKVGLADKANAYPGTLSGGQKQRVAIARALALQPELILFDEPTSALDPELRDDVLAVMRDLAAEGMTMLVVTHETRFAREVADRVVFMEGGTIVVDAPPEQFFGDGASERCRQFLGRLN
ncbi:amino acid ABC transporter ATP-binding protein [Massilia puerhi]|uniref:amino acid ABC transporter ATP-binding protein n=1 Tax=Massilia puerhi TaxID=2681550 RepID=UPI00135A8FFC|nr:amino acid ABC transporter ATP-binding protein [Massilia puerhi]